MFVRPLIRVTLIVLGALTSVGLGGCNSASDMGSTSAHGLASQITAIVLDSAGGYTVSLKGTNVDTGSISDGSGCPVAVQVWQGRRWSPSSEGICRGTAKTIDPGMSLLFTAHNTEISSGDVVRAVTPWMYFNGILPGDSAISPTFAIR